MCRRSALPNFGHRRRTQRRRGRKAELKGRALLRQRWCAAGDSAVSAASGESGPQKWLRS